ncbi:MAG: hypothetical protein PHS93_08925 [Candidatus Omnitrophica bacterium]|nr:hypothetical protein [Candidatus Omnitrophota bacterium]
MSVGWLGTWTKRIKLTIPTTYVTASFGYFPVMIKLSTSSGANNEDLTRVFDELGANNLKLAVTLSDGITECYVEIEKWDNGAEEAILFASHSTLTISHTAPTVLYLYYDSAHANNTSYVGVKNSTPAQSVWDSYTKGSYRMDDGVDTSHIYDSTVNNNDGTKSGVGSPAVTTGKIANAQDFNGNSINITTVLGEISSSTFGAISLTIKVTDATPADDMGIISFGDTDEYSRILLRLTSTGKIRAQCYNSLLARWDLTTDFAVVTDNTYVYISLQHNTIQPTIYINGVAPAQTFIVSTDKTVWFAGCPNIDNAFLGKLSFYGVDNQLPFTGIIDEVRISTTYYTTSFTLCDYHSLEDDLITYSIENFPDSTALFTRLAFVNTPLETSPTWNYIQDDVREIHTARGVNHELDRMEAGTLDLVLNNESGDYWPDNTGGDYTPNVDVMKRIHIACIYDGVFYNVFTGYVESYKPSWLSGGGYGSLMTLHCVGIIGKILSLQVLNNAGYAQEVSGTRIGHVLTDCGIPAGWQTLDAGSDTIMASGANVNVNALDHLQKVQETELSRLYELPSGNVIYESRGHRGISPHTVSQAIFGEDGGAEIPYSSFSYVLDETLLFNDVRVTRSGGTEQTTTNSTSQTNYGKRSFIRSTLHTTDGAAFLLANYIIARYPVTVGRVESMTIVPDDSAKWAQCFTREISDRITFRNDAAGINKDYFIEKVNHDWVFYGTQSFSTSWQLSDATRYLYQPDSINETFRPNAAGDLTQLTPNAGSNYDRVLEAVADDDTTYNSSTGADGAKVDLYNVPDSGYGVGTINSVTIYARVRKEAGSTGAGNARIACKTEGTVYYGSNEALADTYTNITKAYTTNPNTTVAWTWAEVNALQIGIELPRTNAFGILGRITQIYAIVNFTPSW